MTNKPQASEGREDLPFVPQEKRFCKTCGLWFGEFMACEEMDCELETSEEAARRIKERQAND